tara:strand:- start:63 stop:389 length:327 start_codon:yes stop_codon:yes gene_type:complete
MSNLIGIDRHRAKRYTFTTFMPNTKSAIRRIRRVKIQTTVNRIRKSKYKSAIKKMSSYLAEKKLKEAREYLPEFYSQLMKIGKTGVISKNTVSRKISRITKQIQKSKS